MDEAREGGERGRGGEEEEEHNEVIEQDPTCATKSMWALRGVPGTALAKVSGQARERNRTVQSLDAMHVGRGSIIVSVTVKARKKVVLLLEGSINVYRKYVKITGKRGSECRRPHTAIF